MTEKILTGAVMRSFRKHLIEEEKSSATVEKYMRDVRAFALFADTSPLSKALLISYKKHLIDSGYAPRSVNSMIASVNSFLDFAGLKGLKIKALKIQQQPFRPEERELTRAEYERLCRTAEKKGNMRLSLMLQTICSTGIRVSELAFVTAEALKEGKATVSLKGKTRIVFIPKQLRKKLTEYVNEKGIITGAVFVTREGKPISRTTVWREMKSLCREAGVESGKVFPHNLRHLFAKAFYAIEKDIAKLADILGHSSINTTRIYIATTGAEHMKYMERMKLVI